MPKCSMDGAPRAPSCVTRPSALPLRSSGKSMQPGLGVITTSDFSYDQTWMPGLALPDPEQGAF